MQTELFSARWLFTGPEQSRILVASWPLVIVRAAIHLGIAGLLFVYPLIALVGLPLVFGLLASMDAAACLTSALGGTWAHDDRREILLFRAVVGAVAGLSMLAWPLLAPETWYEASVLVIAAWALLLAFVEGRFVLKLHGAYSGERMTGASAILSASLGCIILLLFFAETGTTMLSYGPVIAGYMATAGVLLLIQALRLRMSEHSSRIV